MKSFFFGPIAAWGLVLAFSGMVLGCGQTTNEEALAPVTEVSDGGHNHGGYWCTEHGIPEADCSMCSADAAATCKENGDWCEEHNRAESQCFICDETRAEKFSKLYVAKFGEEPPKPTK